MTVARVAAVGALALVALVLGYLLLGGSGSHEYTLIFQNAGQLVKGDNVQVGGMAVGSVKSIDLTQDNHAAIKVSVDEPYAPLHDGTQAVIRLTSLSGIANRYVALTPGPDTEPKLSDGATLGTAATTTPVDLDQVFNTIDARTRGDLKGVIHGFARQYSGKGAQAGESIKYFNPLLSTARQLVDQVDQDEGALTRFLVNSSEAVTAIADRRDDLASLVGNTNATAGAIARESTALSQALNLLPSTLRRGTGTFQRLRTTLDDLDPLVAASKPATRRLTPFLRQLRPFLDDARPTIADLRTLIQRPGPNDDLIDATAKMPGLERAAKPSFAAGVSALKKSQPILNFIRPYTPELVGWFRDFGVGAANYDANGHYARIQPIFNAFQFRDTPAGGVLTPNLPGERLTGLQTRNLTRCPGAASQPNEDGSAPWRDSGGNLDCDPRESPPGP